MFTELFFSHSFVAAFIVTYIAAIFQHFINDADQCLFHVTSMEMSHEKGHASGLWLVDFDPSCLSMSNDGCQKITAITHYAHDSERGCYTNKVNFHAKFNAYTLPTFWDTDH